MTAIRPFNVTFGIRTDRIAQAHQRDQKRPERTVYADRGTGARDHPRLIGRKNTTGAKSRRN